MQTNTFNYAAFEQSADWARFAAENGLLYHPPEDTSVPQRAGSLFRTLSESSFYKRPAEIRSLHSVEGTYQDLVFEVGHFRHVLPAPKSGGFIEQVSFLRVILPVPVPHAAADQLFSGYFTTKSPEIKDGQWLRPPQDIFGRVNLRCTRGFEADVAVVLPPELLRHLVAAKVRFSIEVIQDEFYIYIYGKLKKPRQTIQLLLDALQFVDAEKIKALRSSAPLDSLPVPAACALPRNGAQHSISVFIFFIFLILFIDSIIILRLN